MNILELRGLVVERGGIRLIDDLDLDINPGEIVAVFGASGCGKTTLLHAINGLIPHHSSHRVKGVVSAGGLDVSSYPPERRCRHMGTVLQNFESQIVHGRVDDELAFGPENLAEDSVSIGVKVDRLCSTLGLPPQADPALLSGGMQQKLCIGGALAMDVPLLLLDEPFSNIDRWSADILCEQLSKIRDMGTSVLLTEHRFDIVSRVADRMLRLEGGRMIDVHGPDTTELPRIRSAGSGEQILRMDSVRFSYKIGRPIIKDADMVLHQGESVVLTGPNGSGKSTLLRLAAGLRRPDSGRVELFGRRSTVSRARGVCGLVWQNPGHQLFMGTVMDEMTMNCRNPEYAMGLLEELGLSDLSSRHPLSLSEGEKRRLAVASVLAGEPDILLLDEPTLGQDRQSLSMVLDSLISRCEDGMALLTVTHDPEVASCLSGREIRLENGSLREV